MMLRIIVALGLTAILLAGCGPTKKQDLATCMIEAYRMYPQAVNRADDDKTAEYISTCMEAKGYAFASPDKACRVTQMATPTPEALAFAQRDEACYSPAN